MACRGSLFPPSGSRHGALGATTQQHVVQRQRQRPKLLVRAARHPDIQENGVYWQSNTPTTKGFPNPEPRPLGHIAECEASQQRLTRRPTGEFYHRPFISRRVMRVLIVVRGFLPRARVSNHSMLAKSVKLLHAHAHSPCYVTDVAEHRK